MNRDEYSRIRDSISWNNSSDTTNASDIVLNKFGNTWASQLLQQQVYLVSPFYIYLNNIILMFIV